MSFTDAIIELLAGSRITRKAWDDKRTYGILKNGILQIHKAGQKEEKLSPWILSDGDMLANDWMTL